MQQENPVSSYWDYFGSAWRTWAGFFDGDPATATAAAVIVVLFSAFMFKLITSKDS